MSRGPNPTPDDEAPSSGSDEMFYVGEDGERQDSALHEELLGTGAEEDDSAAHLRAAIESGMEPELAESLYG